MNQSTVEPYYAGFPTLEAVPTTESIVDRNSISGLQFGPPRLLKSTDAYTLLVPLGTASSDYRGEGVVLSVAGDRGIQHTTYEAKFSPHLSYAIWLPPTEGVEAKVTGDFAAATTLLHKADYWLSKGGADPVALADLYRSGKPIDQTSVGSIYGTVNPIKDRIERAIYRAWDKQTSTKGIFICRGAQIAFSEALQADPSIVESSHAPSEADNFVPTAHAVTFIAPRDIALTPRAAKLLRPLATISTVSSHHCLGFCYTEETVKKLRTKGWYVVLVSSGIEDRMPIIEMAVKVVGGEIIGVATQGHPERRSQPQQDPQLLQFIRELLARPEE